MPRVEPGQEIPDGRHGISDSRRTGRCAVLRYLDEAEGARGCRGAGSPASDTGGNTGGAVELGHRRSEKVGKGGLGLRQICLQLNAA